MLTTRLSRSQCTAPARGHLLLSNTLVLNTLPRKSLPLHLRLPTSPPTRTTNDFPPRPSTRNNSTTFTPTLGIPNRVSPTPTSPLVTRGGTEDMLFLISSNSREGARSWELEEREHRGWEARSEEEEGRAVTRAGRG
jgi:hypothetical protein